MATLQTTLPRRAVLAASFGGLAAITAHAIGGPTPARAASGDNLVIGSAANDSGVDQTALTSTAPGATLNVTNTVTNGEGILGSAGHGIGVEAFSGGATSPAAHCQSGANATGVIGQSGGDDPKVVAPAKTGVYGYAAQDSAARGVYGRSTLGTGVLAQADSGGTALRVSGKASFSRSGRASVSASHASVDVTVSGGLAATANVLATLQAYRAGVYVAAVRINYPTAGKARIYLNKVASTTVTTPVAWFVLG